MSPVINKKIIREKPVKYQHEKAQDCTPFYGSTAWRRLRYTLLTAKPLCEECLRHQKVTPAEDAHHLTKFLSGKTEQEKWELFLNESNIRMLCSKCHHGYHKKMDIYHLNYVDGLTDKEYNDIHTIDY